MYSSFKFRFEEKKKSTDIGRKDGQESNFQAKEEVG